MIVDGSYRKRLDSLMVLAVVCAAAMLLQSVFYSMTGDILFSAMTNTSGADVSIRDFGIRFSPPGGLMSFSAIYSVVCTVFAKTGKRDRTIYSICSLMLISAIVFVYQTRMEDIALIGSLLLGIVICIESGKLSKGLKRLLVALLVVTVLGMGFLDSFIATFSSTDTVYSGSTSLRLYAYSYYIAVSYTHLDVYKRQVFYHQYEDELIPCFHNVLMFLC